MSKSFKIKVEDKPEWEVARGHYQYHNGKCQHENRKKYRRNRRNEKRAWLDSKSE